MEFFDRALQNLRANAKLEPERELAQTLAAMQKELLLLRQAVASAIALQKSNERQKLQEEAATEDLQRRAKAALSGGNERLAREFLTQRQARLKTARALQGQIAQQSEIIEQMHANLRHLEQKLSEAVNKQEMYLARARSAEALRRFYKL